MNKSALSVRTAIAGLIVIALAAPSQFLHASVKDNELWTSVEIDYSPIKGLDIGFENELRLNDNFTGFNQYYSEIGMKYKFFSYFKLSAYYRHKIRTEKSENSFHINAFLERDIDDLEVSFRLRYHRKYPQKDNIENYFRPKLELKYKIDKVFSPFAGAEFFYRANYLKGDRFDKMRLYFGLGIEPFKNNKFDVYYLHQQDMNEKKISLSNIFGLKYGVSF